MLCFLFSPAAMFTVVPLCWSSLVICDGKRAVVVLHLVLQDWLSAGHAHEELPIVLQCVLQGVESM